MINIVIILVIAVLLILDVKHLMVHGVEDCSGNCGDCHGSCGSSCKFTQDIMKAKKSIERKNKLKRILHLS